MGFWKILLFAGLAASAAAQTQSWKIDPAHSAAQFSVRHMGISTVRGEFQKLSGTVDFNPSDVTKSAINATIDATTVNTRVDMRDKDLRSPNFLEVEKYPQITFNSKSVQSAGTGKLRVIGDLTIRGVTKEVMLDVDGPSAAIKDPMGNSRMGASAATKINRKDFGVNGAPAMVGDEITITLDVEMIVPGAK
jgi:polyisoprenoid-binding protein YceI